MCLLHRADWDTFQYKLKTVCLSHYMWSRCNHESTAGPSLSCDLTCENTGPCCPVVSGLAVSAVVSGTAAQWNTIKPFWQVLHVFHPSVVSTWKITCHISLKRLINNLKVLMGIHSCVAVTVQSCRDLRVQGLDVMILSTRWHQTALNTPQMQHLHTLPYCLFSSADHKPTYC